MIVHKPEKTSVSMKDVVRILSEKHRKIGSGRDAVVFKGGRKKALKLWSPFYRISIWDDPYTDFLKIIPSDHPMFPGVYSINLFEHKKESYGLVEMELLHEACQFEYSQDNDPKKSRLFAKAVNQLVKDFGLERYRLPLHPHDQLEQAVGLLFKSGCVAQTLAAKQFLEIVDKLNRAGHAIDVHMGNVMIRRPPRRMEVVITDPLA